MPTQTYSRPVHARRRRGCGRLLCTAACAGVIGISIASPTFAAERTWTSSTDRFFTDPNAWSGATVPGAADSARFNLGSAYSVLFPSSASNQFATFNSGTVSLNLGASTYSLTSTASTSLVVGSLNLFFTTPAWLNIASDSGSGVLQDQSASIGNTRGPATVTVGAASWNSAGTLTLGDTGAATLNVNAGGVVFTPNAVLGDGTTSTGSLTINSGGRFTAQGGAFGGGGVTFDVGGSGNGSIKVNSGGFLNCGSFNSTMNVGRDAGSHGTITLSGGSWSSVLSTSGGIVNVGLSGSGSINASSGTISCRVIHLGVNAGAVGNLNISGSAVVSTTGIGIGGTAGPGSAAGGTGAVNLSGGILNGGQMWLWPNGALNLTGGTLNVTQLFLDGGTFDWSAGTYSTAENLTIGPASYFHSLALDATKGLAAPRLTVGDGGGASTLTIANSTCPTPLIVSQHSAVGVTNGSARLQQLTSGSVTVSNGTLVLDSSSGLVSGASISLSNSHLSDTNGNSSLTLGNDGTGVATFLFTGGSAANLNFFSMHDDGLVLIDGSSWTSSGAGTATIGDNLQGTMSVQNGGVFRIGSGVLGRGLIAAGTMNVTGPGTTWTMFNTGGGTGILSVGRGGVGTLNITNAAQVNAIIGIVGELAGSRGSVLIDGATLSLSQDLRIGQGGTGSLTVTNGGAVSCGHGYVGQTGNAVGTVVVSGTGSSWTGTAGLDIGGGQSGWFTLGPGATMSPGGSINIGANGVLDYEGGTLGPGTLVLAAGRIHGNGSVSSPIVNLNGTIDVDSGNTLTVSSSLTNSAGGSLTKLGPGAADVASFISSGAGSIVVNEGALTIRSDAGSSASATPTVTVGQASAVLNFGATQHLTALNVPAGRVDLLPDGSRVLVTGSISLAASGALLDLNDNDFQFNYTGFSPYPTIAGWIQQGRNGGAWDGAGGITSSVAAARLNHNTTFGILEGFEFHSIYGAAAQFDGQVVFNSSLLLRYTLFGDANFDRKVDLTDFTFLAANFNGTGKDWLQGDFNYDDKVDLTDFTFLAANFNQSLPAETLGAADFGELSRAVPEPAFGITLSLVGAALARRRRN